MKDLNGVLTNLNSKLDPDCLGHSIAIYRQLELELSTGHGIAVAPLPAKVMTSRTRMDVLSMSKTLTAAAVVHALLTTPDPSVKGSKQISLDQHIDQWLPQHWTIDPGYRSITFRQLLTHTSGIRPAVAGDPDFVAPGPDSSPWGAARTYEEIQTLVATPPPHPPGVHVYCNGNYSLLRVLVSYLDEASVIESLTALGGGIAGVTSAAIYVAYVKRWILEPIGLSKPYPGLVGSASDQAEWYSTKSSTSGIPNNSLHGDALLRAGSDYWDFNVREWGSFVAHLTQNRIAPFDHAGTGGLWSTMRDNGLGVYPFAVGDGTTAYGHNGGWDGSAGGAFTAWMAFHEGVTVTYFSNTRIPHQTLSDGSDYYYEQEQRILDAWNGVKGPHTAF